MKKSLTLLLLIGFCATGFAQKTIDVSLDEILQPTEMVSTLSGTAIPIKLSCKNNGTDIIEVGDSIFWNAILIDVEAEEILFQIPINASNGSGFLTHVTKQIGVGDTIHVGRNFTTPFFLNFSRTLRVLATCRAVNRTNEITDNNTDNNTTFAEITWWNIDRNGVSINNVKYNNNIAAYPNPASNQLNIELVLTKFDDVKVELIDLTGNTVLSEDITSSINDRSYSVDVSTIANGLYIVKVTNGDKISTTKVNILH